MKTKQSKQKKHETFEICNILKIIIKFYYFYIITIIIKLPSFACTQPTFQSDYFLFSTLNVLSIIKLACYFENQTFLL